MARILMWLQLANLQEEAWKLQMYMELETIKHQLAQLSAVRAELALDELQPLVAFVDALRAADLEHAVVPPRDPVAN